MGIKKEHIPLLSFAMPLTMGVRGGQKDAWLNGPDPLGISGLYERQITEKKQLAQSRPEQIFALTQQAEPAASEAVQTIKNYLAANPHLANDVASQDSDKHPLLYIACQIPEDILLLLADSTGQWRLVGGCLAFPAHWVLAEKIGRTMAEIHVPVPGYDKKLAQPVNRFFGHMQAGLTSRRQNWALQYGPALYAPYRTAHTTAIDSAQRAGQQIYLRMETQHFYKMAKTGAIIFSIRTSLAPLCHWQDRPQTLAPLAEQIKNLSPEMRAYKGLEGLDYGLDLWLRNPNID